MNIPEDKVTAEAWRDEYGWNLPCSVPGAFIGISTCVPFSPTISIVLKDNDGLPPHALCSGDGL